jgi:RNA polymerase sigma-70 factor (ECF subfamily)
VDTVRIEQNADKTFAWALSRTFSREEAEELSQEILFRALKSLHELRDESKFDAWFWRLADITLKVYRRGKAKERTRLSYDEVTLPPYDEDFDSAFDDTADKLRRYIAELSASYRDIIVMHYYDNLTCKTISEKLALPEGTVTYRLSMARSKLKTRCISMKETALKPQKLSIHISGEGNYNGTDRPFPWQYIDDALSQNILYYAYREPKTVEELSELTGVPAFYIEDRIENLIERDAVIRPTKNTIQTDFVIFDEPLAIYIHENKTPFIESVADEFYNCTAALTQQTIDTGIYTAERTFDELLCLFSLLALEESVPKYAPIEYVKPTIKYDGYAWDYTAKVIGMNNDNATFTSATSEFISEPESYMHRVYEFAPFGERQLLYKEENSGVMRAIIRGEKLDERQKEKAGEMIASGFLKREDNGAINPTMPVITREQHEKLKACIDEIFKDFLPIYQRKYKEHMTGYTKLYPSQVFDKAKRYVNFFFVAMFSDIAAVWQKQGKLTIPSGAICDVLLGHE